LKGVFMAGFTLLHSHFSPWERHASRSFCGRDQDPARSMVSAPAEPSSCPLSPR
jgi:hypothetical protein